MKQIHPVSVMTFPFGGHLARGELSLEGMLAGLKAIGFDGVEVFLAELTGTARRLEQYRSRLAENALALACIDAICDFVSRDAAVRREAAAIVRKGIETAGALGCTRVMLAGSVLKDGISPEDGRQMIADGIASQAALARQAGVTLLVEDYGMAPTLLCRAADCLEVIRLAGNPEQVKFTFDTGNFVFAGEDPVRNLDVLQPLVHHVHVKAWRTLAERQPGDAGEYAGYIGCPVDQGVIPNRVLVERLLARGYAGWFSLECSVPGAPLAAAERDYRALKPWLSTP